jgi:S1-C subfamily serine protease
LIQAACGAATIKQRYAEENRMTKSRRLDSFRIWRAGFGLLFAAFALLIVTDTYAAYGHQRPVLGVGVEGLDFRELDKMGLPYGVRVIGVTPNSPAELAGVKPGDIITAIDGMAVFSPARLQWLASEAHDKKETTLSLHREGTASDLRVDLSKASGGYGMGKKAVGGHSFIGIGMQPMNRVMSEAFGSPPEIGVLVTEVLQDSPAMQAGIKEGDVIIGLAGKAVDELSDIYRALNYFEPGETLSLNIYREKQEKSVKVTLGAMPVPAWGHGMRYPGGNSHSGHSMMPHHIPWQMQTR